MEERHVFLTGERGVGKSAVIRAVTERLAARGAEIGGFKTVPGPECALYLLPYGADADDSAELSPPRLVALRDRRNSRFESRPAVFDGTGADILLRAARCDLIVMDELGFMEAEAFAFQEAVLSRLDGVTPVFGVVKPPAASKGVAFLSRVRAHRNARLFTVTRDNRDGLPDLLYAFFERTL